MSRPPPSRPSRRREKSAAPGPTHLRSGRELKLRSVALPGGPSLAYAEAGSGPDLVLLHGTLTTLEDMWLGPMPALASRFRVLALDRPGHGRSTRSRLQDASIWRQAEIIRNGCRALGLSRPILVGHSLGGAVALAYAMSWPEEVGGVVAIAPICFPELRLEQILFGPRALPWLGEGLAAALGATSDPLLLPVLWRAMFLPQEMPERFAAEFPFKLAAQATYIVADAENAAHLWPDLTRSARAYQDCPVPVRFLCGDLDLVVNNLLHGYVAAQLLPRARFRWLHGYGHMLHHFRAEEVLAAAEDLHDVARPGS